MITQGKIKTGEYFDSVTLMQIGKEIAALPDVIDAACVMGTKENKSILASSQLLTDDFANVSDSDLLIVIKAANKAVIDAAFSKVDEIFAAKRKKKSASSAGDTFAPCSIEGAVKVLTDANLVLISIAGKYAGNEAMKALQNGLNVMLFSDNVSLATEIELKEYAAKKGLLVMGPDCGTAIINGVPLAFANVVNSGNIGIVAASGTGLQELTCVISNEGAGISQAIGTGGRDVKQEVGGVMFLAALKALAQDPKTEVIVLASKPPHASVIKKIADIVKTITKPVIAVFLGADKQEVEQYGMIGATTFAETALKAVALSKKESFDVVAQRLAKEKAEITKTAEKLVARCNKTQKYLRGLFSGGTFCAEAQVVFNGVINEIYSNAPMSNAQRLQDSLKSEKNTVIDLGEDEFTVGRPHPMIDYSLRNRKILQEAQDSNVAVILLDVVLGYGSNMDPGAELAPIIKQIRKQVIVIASITGTNNDPQNRQKVAAELAEAGAIIMSNNAAACLLAAEVIKKLG